MLRLTVTTVERKLLDRDDVKWVTLPTKEGEITVLPSHLPLMGVLGMGELRISFVDEGQSGLFVEGGILQVKDNQVDVLADLAEKAEELDTAKIEEAKRRAERLLKEKPVEMDLVKVKVALQRELAKLKIAKRR